MRKYLIILFLFLSSYHSFSQSNNLNYVASFLDINTNARLAGFGEVGVVSSPFYNNSGVYQNPALISKHAHSAGANVFYMPWLSKLVDNSYFTGLAGFYAIDSTNAIALNFTYNSRGNITFIDEYGNYIESNNPYECYFKLGYNHSFNEYISTGIAFKYFRSDIVPINTEVNTVNSVALDLGLNYDKKYQLNKQSFLNTSAGIDFSNLGPKISYIDGEKDFIPSKLAMGLFINPDIHLYKSLRLNIELGYQAEKYLVPTPPIYDLDGNIINGYDSNISSFKALYQSFYDAPGGGVM